MGLCPEVRGRRRRGYNSPRDLYVRRGLSNSFGFGGTNSAPIFQRY
jgi:3-oxoacyl-(acyl-carrier-protein) synthase